MSQSSQSSAIEGCPVEGCSFSGPIRRVFGHIRQVHDSNDWSRDLILRFNLTQCQFCNHWFSRLNQHSGTCPARVSPSNHPVTGSDGAVASPTSSSIPITKEDRESEAWSFLASISIADILHSTPPRTVQNILPSLRSDFQDCCSLPLSKIRDDPEDINAWKLLFLLPRMLLPPSGGQNK